MLAVRDLVSGYGGVPVLRGVSLDVGPGEVVAVLGANGVGKTTLNATISGLVRASAGEIVFDGARIDGLNELQIWWSVAMPLVKPALAALAIFTFLGNWTAFFWPLIVTTSKELYTLPVGLSSFAVEQSIQWEMIMTGAALATIPTLFVFIVLQRYIVRGVMLAGLKG